MLVFDDGFGPGILALVEMVTPFHHEPLGLPQAPPFNRFRWY